MTTLPDYLSDNLAVVTVGINPSLASIAAGYYFANPRNRFWPALTAAGLCPADQAPGVAAQEYLFAQGEMGFTDVVKRATPGASQLRAADYRIGAPVLRDKLYVCAPRVVWFHGKEAFKNYCRFTGAAWQTIAWGEQSLRIGASRVFVSPNPSPANAVFSLHDLIAWYAELREFRDRITLKTNHQRGETNGSE